MPEVEVVGLLTTTNEAFDRVAMHAVRRTLLEAQAEAAGMPLMVAPLPWPCSNKQYEEVMRGALKAAVEKFGITHVAFGDLYLADVRRYREERMAGTGLEPLFPLWLKPTADLAREMLAAGLRARVTCIDPSKLPLSFAGREYDAQFLADLPEGIDPCAESGEFHTFAYDGPMFSHPIAFTPGEVVERDGFVFADLIPLAADY